MGSNRLLEPGTNDFIKYLLINKGYSRSKNKKQKGEIVLMVAVHVDDLIVFNKNLSDLNHLKDCLKENFGIRVLGELSYCLGLNVVIDGDKIVVNQKRYILIGYLESLQNGGL